MEPRERPDFSTWPSILFVILLATTSAFLARVTLESERPPPTGQGVSTAVIQDRDARLWQDPFGVATRKSEPPSCYEVERGPAKETFTLRSCKQEGSGSSGHDLAWLRRLMEARGGQTRIFYALVPGGTWVGADEYRRRQRYAILAGANLQGYVPEDPEHLGYLEDRVASALDPRAEWPVSLPFEWLSHEDEERHVLLVWVDEETLGQTIVSGSTLAAHFPLTRLTALVEALADASAQPQPTHTILGPFSSTFLRAVISDPELEEAAKTLRMRRTQWYSPTATLPDEKLMADVGGKQTALREVLPNFHRMIVSDDELADALAQEIKGRNVEPEDAIALVGLWDTAYSRRLRELIEQHIEDVFPPFKAPTVITASYLRGLDGRLPHRDHEGDNESKRDEKRTDHVERPEGDSQIDYLRRLALSLNRWQQENSKRIAAVGVIGDDYYDKLLALKALRPSFPGRIFFTTDLDAAMLHPADNKVTRNLVVASGYGLTLRPELQRDIPPFRYAYQSAAFLATQVALGDGSRFALPTGDQDKGCLLRAQLFEIGYTEAVELTGGRVTGRCDVPKPYRDPRPPAPLPPGWKDALKPPAAVLLAGLLLWVVGVTHRAHLRWWGWVLGGTAIVSAAMVLLLNHAPQLREPLGLVQGVSIWPSQFLRLLAIVAAVALLLKGRRMLRDNLADIEEQYPEIKESAASMGARPESSKKTRRSASWQAMRRCLSKSGPEDSGADVARLWRIYRHARTSPVRACLPSWFAGTVFMAVVLLAALGLATVFGETPNTPTRGQIELKVDRAVLVGAVGSFLLLLLQASSESFRAVWLTRRLQSQNAWPEATVWRYRQQLCLGGTGQSSLRASLACWLDVKLIAKVTEPVQRIVFYPFAILALLILARSPLFDAWDTPGSLRMLFLVFSVLLVAAAWRLRATAERLRRQARQRLMNDIADAKIAGAADLAARLQAMLDYMGGLATGAFLPFSQQPLVRAALTVLGSYSGIALLEYARLVNL